MSGHPVDSAISQRLADLALVVVVGALVVAAAALDADTTALDFGFLVVSAAALAFHRTAPLVVLAVATVSGAAYVLHAHPGPLGALSVFAAVHLASKTHISRAMTKLGARDRAQLVVFAYESGLVTARGS